MAIPRHSQTTRRGFLALAAGTLGAGQLAFAATGRPGPGGRFATAHAGLGQRGAWLLQQPGLDAQLLFDVDRRQLTGRALAARAGAHAADGYRQLLDSAQVDAIVIATPDHWHVPLAVAACEAGKDVYLESPCTWLPGEADALIKAARRWGTVVQTGETLPYTRAGVALRERLQALSQAATLEVTCTAPLNPEGGSFDELPVPEELDWRQWLGRATARPFHEDLLHGGWRHTLDLGGGTLRTAGTHMVATLLWATGDTPDTAKISAEGARNTAGLWDVPRNLSATLDIGSRLRIRWLQDEGAAPAMRIEAAGEMLQLEGLGDEAVLKVGDSIVAGPGWDAQAPTAHWADAMQRRVGARLPLETACAASAITQAAIAAWRSRGAVELNLATWQVQGNDLARRLLAIPPWSDADVWR
jgi:predicted dehydrogenase